MASTYAYTIFTLCPALAMSIALQAPSPSVGDHLGSNLGTTVTGDIGTLSVANGIGVTASNVLPTAQIQTATYSGGVPPTCSSNILREIPSANIFIKQRNRATSLRAPRVRTPHTRWSAPSRVAALPHQQAIRFPVIVQQVDLFHSRPA